MCVGGKGADLDYRALSADFPPSSPRFHGRSPRSPLLPENPLSRHSPPQYPCFALADLIRDSALNLVRYTAVCMPRLALPATSATHTLSPSHSLSPLPSRAYYLPSAHAGIHVHSNPPISRIVSSLVSTLLARRSLASGDRFMPPTLFFLIPLFLSFSSFPSVFISFFRSLFLFSLRQHLYLSLDPLVTVSIPENNHRLQLFSHPSRCPEREHLPTLLMFPLSVSPSRLPSPTQAASSPPPTSLFHPLLQQHYLNPTYVFHPSSPVFEWDRTNASKGVVVIVVVPSFAFKLD